MTSVDLSNLFESAGCKLVQPSILQPADPFLNAAGEAFRKSVFVTSSADGETLCLRPEFTIPVCLQHEKGEARYHYHGTVFRQRIDAYDKHPQEFMQAGVEALGETDFAKADADMVRLALRAIKHLSDIDPVILIGDPAFFNALVGPIGLPDIWRERLTRAFGDADLIDRMIARMVSAAPDLEAGFHGVDETELTNKVATMMIEHGLATAGGRTPEEIAARFLKKRGEQVAVATATAEICQLFLALECAGPLVGETMSRFGHQHNVDFSTVISTFDARLKAGLGELDAPITFAANFGRRLDYYTGFVFEIYDANNRKKGPLAGGGRYDHLTEMLGGAPLPAVGFSLWLDRMGGVE